MKNYRLLLGLLVILGACLIGCGGGGGGGGNGGGNPTPGTSGTGANNPTNPVVTQVTLAPSTPSIMVGQAVTLTALGKDATSASVIVNPNNWLWTISDSSLATITSAGDHATVTGTKVGTLTLSAKEGSSGITNSTTITITAVPVQPGNGGPGSTIVYQNDFSGGADTKWSNQTISAIPNTTIYSSPNFLGEFGAQTVSLSLANLPAHGNVTVDFDLFIIRSMDGNAGNPIQGPDTWNLTADGVGTPLINTSFSNIVPNALLGFPEGYFQAYPGDFPGGSFPYQTGAKLTNKLGFVYAGTVLDAVYHITRKFAHTDPTLKLNYTSTQTQAIADESWGLKNVIISVSP
jgi:hypothetical protein